MKFKWLNMHQIETDFLHMESWLHNDMEQEIDYRIEFGLENKLWQEVGLPSVSVASGMRVLFTGTERG